MIGVLQPAQTYLCRAAFPNDPMRIGGFDDMIDARLQNQKWLAQERQH